MWPALQKWICCKKKALLHAKLWIPGGEKSIFTVVIHSWRSPSRQFALERTIDEYTVQIQLRLRHNPKSENTFFSDNGEMSDRWLIFFSEIVCYG